MLDEEEARAELAGPELLLKQLKELLGQEGAEGIVDLPDGIHSGLRRANRNGMSFYFQAPRPSGEGKRHFWCYIDAATHEIIDNRFQVAQIIECQKDEPRHIGNQDVFSLQEVVIEHILGAEQRVEARAAASAKPDTIQQTIAEELKNAIRRGSVDRDQAKAMIRFLAQPAGPFLIRRMRTAYKGWSEDRQDAALLEQIGQWAQDFGKADAEGQIGTALRREDLKLVCFEYVSS